MRSLRGRGGVERGENAKGRREREGIAPSPERFGVVSLFFFFGVVSGEGEWEMTGGKSGEGRGRWNGEKRWKRGGKREEKMREKK